MVKMKKLQPKWEAPSTSRRRTANVLAHILLVWDGLNPEPRHSPGKSGGTVVIWFQNTAVCVTGGSQKQRGTSSTKMRGVACCSAISSLWGPAPTCVSAQLFLHLSPHRFLCAPLPGSQTPQSSLVSDLCLIIFSNAWE